MKQYSSRIDNGTLPWPGVLGTVQALGAGVGEPQTTKGKQRVKEASPHQGNKGGGAAAPQ